MGKLDHIKEVRGCILTSRGLQFCHCMFKQARFSFISHPKLKEFPHFFSFVLLPKHSWYI